MKIGCMIPKEVKTELYNGVIDAEAKKLIPLIKRRRKTAGPSSRPARKQ